jgi:glycerophosphoryl diester phosphodiesterase
VRQSMRSAPLCVLLSLLVALPVAQGSSLAAVSGVDQSVSVDGGVGTAGPVTVPTSSGPASGQTAPVAPMVDDELGTSALQAVPTDTTALLGDFDGDHRSDLFWYGPGSKADHLWLGRPDRNFVGSPVTVRGSYRPLVGDFNGDGRADVFWYGPGAAADVLWFGQAGGRFAGRAITVSGTYQPFLGNFNGDRATDIFWYGPGAGYDVVWFGRTDGGFTVRAFAVNGTYQPLAADFNGDGRGDIFWYGAGAAADVLWFGQAGSGFSGQAVTVNGTYQPLVADFNGDRSRDILWYGAGAAGDVLWYGHANGRFTGYAINVQGSYQPFIGDFDGDHRSDIFWYGPGAGYDVVWYGLTGGGFGANAATVSGTYQPLPAEYSGDGVGDVIWYAPGDPDDHLWFGHTNRVFTSRGTTVDIGYTRAVPLRQATITGQYDPYGFVAHALGAIDGRGYTNSLEAFQRNYGRGFRVFEADMVRLKDGTALVAHDGLEANYGLSKPFTESTWADLAGHKYLGRYTILRSQDLVALLRQHTDAYFILDIKYARPEIYRTIIGQAPERHLRERLFPHVDDQAELNAYRITYPVQNYVLCLYHSQARNEFDDPQVVDFVRRNRSPSVMMWWRERNLSISLAANGRESRRFRRPFVDALHAAGAVTYVHSLDDPVEIQRFWDLGVGVYSNETFPPLSATLTAQTVQMPTFGARVEASPPA